MSGAHRRVKDLEQAVAEMQTITAAALRGEYGAREALSELDLRLRAIMEKK